MNLWLVRHAQPLMAAGICYGALDVAADPFATLQAASALAQVLPQGVQVICSPLQRCELLAQSVQGLRPDLTYKTDARLAEMNFGSHEGQPWDKIPKAAYDDWTADFWQHRFGGAESVAEFMQRVAAVWDDMPAPVLPSGQSRQLAQAQVWITHAGVIRAAHLLAQGVRQIDRAGQWPAQAPGFGEFCRLIAGQSAVCKSVDEH